MTSSGSSGEATRGSFHQDGTPLLRWNRDFRTMADLPAAPDPPSAPAPGQPAVA